MGRSVISDGFVPARSSSRVRALSVPLTLCRAFGLRCFVMMSSLCTSPEPFSAQSSRRRRAGRFR